MGSSVRMCSPPERTRSIVVELDHTIRASRPLESASLSLSLSLSLATKSGAVSIGVPKRKTQANARLRVDREFAFLCGPHALCFEILAQQSHPNLGTSFFCALSRGRIMACLIEARPNGVFWNNATDRASGIGIRHRVSTRMIKKTEFQKQLALALSRESSKVPNLAIDIVFPIFKHGTDMLSFGTRHGPVRFGETAQSTAPSPKPNSSEFPTVAFLGANTVASLGHITIRKIWGRLVCA